MAETKTRIGTLVEVWRRGHGPGRIQTDAFADPDEKPVVYVEYPAAFVGVGKLVYDDRQGHFIVKGTGDGLLSADSSKNSELCYREVPKKGGDTNGSNNNTDA